MPTDALQFYYDPHYRPNRRRPKYPVLQALLRLILWIVALMVIIGVLMKVGIIKEPVIVLASQEDQLNAVEKILDQLLNSDRLNPSQIALLVAGGITDFSGFKGLKRIGSHSLTGNIKDWQEARPFFWNHPRNSRAWKLMWLSSRGCLSLVLRNILPNPISMSPHLGESTGCS